MVKQFIKLLLQGHRFHWRLPARRTRSIALTFDDGPHPQFTPQILDLLAAQRCLATFFVLGTAVEQYPEIVARIIREGHDIGIHGYDHRRRGFARQVEDCRRRLAPLGIAPTAVRPPYGQIGVFDALRLLLRGCHLVFWNVDLQDSLRHDGKRPPSIGQPTTIAAGDIVLLHDDNPVCVAELPQLLQAVASQGLACVTWRQAMNSRPAG